MVIISNNTKGNHMSDWKDDLNTRKNNISGLFSNSNTKPIVIAMGIILAGMVAYGYFSVAKASDVLPASAKIKQAGDRVSTDPSIGGSAVHTELQRRQNAMNEEIARNRGVSNIPTLTTANSDNNPLQLPTLTRNQPQAVQELPQIPPPTPTPVVEYEPEPEIKERVVNENVNAHILEYLKMWGPARNQLQEFEYARTFDASKYAQAQSENNQKLNSNSNVSTSYKPTSKFRFIRAGSVVPAKLLTPINSDNPGPVMAEITSGPLSGARMFGTITKQQSAVLIKFSQIMKPGWPDNYAISAVGMTDDGYTGIATDVNNHYIQRYSAILAGSFMQGYGRGLMQQGRSTIITEGGAVISDTKELNSEQIRNQGFGEVVTRMGGEITDKLADRQPTIKVEGNNGAPYRFKVLFINGF